MEKWSDLFYLIRATSAGVPTKAATPPEKMPRPAFWKKFRFTWLLWKLSRRLLYIPMRAVVYTACLNKPALNLKANTWTPFHHFKSSFLIQALPSIDSSDAFILQDCSQSVEAVFVQLGLATFTTDLHSVLNQVQWLHE